MRCLTLASDLGELQLIMLPKYSHPLTALLITAIAVIAGVVNVKSLPEQTTEVATVREVGAVVAGHEEGHAENVADAKMVGGQTKANNDTNVKPGGATAGQANVNTGSTTPTQTTTAHAQVVDPKNFLVSGASSSQLLINSGEAIPALSGDGTGDFRLVCRFSHMNYDDPLVYPGQVGAAHLHTFFGNTNANANSTTSSLKNSGSSTCDGGIVNRSAYWAPSLLDANNMPVPIEYGYVYYKSGYRSVAPANINNLPAGLKMIAGNQAATTDQSSDIVSWSCDTPTYSGDFTSIPNFCGNGGRMVYTITFPQCWNGKDLDSADHKSHMAYPGYGTGCPSTHPVAIPVISLRIRYIQNTASTTGWHLSSDHYDVNASNIGGKSAHADFMDGWNDQIRDGFTQNCIRAARDCGVRSLGDGRALQMLPL